MSVGSQKDLAHRKRPLRKKNFKILTGRLPLPQKKKKAIHESSFRAFSTFGAAFVARSSMAPSQGLYFFGLVQ